MKQATFCRENKTEGGEIEEESLYGEPIISQVKDIEIYHNYTFDKK